MKNLLLTVLLTCVAPMASALALAADLPTGQSRYDCAGSNKNVLIAWSDTGLVKVRYFEDGKFKEENALMIKGVKDGIVRLKAPDFSRQVQYDIKQKRATLQGFSPAEITCSLPS